MFADWLAREGWIFVQWWLVIFLMGVTVLPLSWRLLRGLPDFGYTLTKSLGLLLIAFVFWALAVLGFLPNSTGSILLAWAIVAVISLVAYMRSGERVSWRGYWRENGRVIVASEVLFVVLFLGLMVFRAYQNDTSSTEKPMDLMFISSILRSETFPPNDAWLSGYAISYYHFGYVMVAMLAKLTGITSGASLSMTLALWFAMTGLNALGVVYNLIRARVGRDEGYASRRWAIGAGILGAFMVVFMSNFQFPLIELPYQLGVGDDAYYQYWGTQARTTAPLHSVEALRTDVAEWDRWWWWRASRVLTDYNLDGSALPSWYAQPIDEFPQFSFLLGDTHPHVLALPFGVMALGLALNVLLVGRSLSVIELVFYGVTVGSFIFLNTWDILAYFGAFIGANALRRVMRSRGQLTATDWVGLFGDGAVFFLVALVAYFPFLYSFRTQASGFVPNLIFPTYFPQFFVMFAPFLLLLGVLLSVEVWRGMRDGRMNWRVGFGVSGGLLLVMVVLLGVAALRALAEPQVLGVARSFIDGLGGLEAVLSLAIQRRISYAPVALLMLFVIAVVLARVFAKPRMLDVAPVSYSATTGFVLVLMGIGAVLVFVPEFIYLRDNFGARINTIFKFYYQVWVLWAIASAYGVYLLIGDETERAPRLLSAFSGGLAVSVVILGALYGVLSFHNRAVLDRRAPADALSIDGTPYMTLTLDDYAVIQCLDQLVRGDEAVVAEAVRDAYAPHYGRVGSITGIPIVMGWENHQRQWRGVTYDDVAGTRKSDVDMLYNTYFWDEALPIINKYGIDYIMMGQTERNQYDSSGEDKFIDRLEVACESGRSRVYRVTANALIVR